MTNQVNQDERNIAMQEAYQINDSDEYFKARPQLECEDRRKVFYAGHIRGYQAATQASESEINSLKQRIKELEEAKKDLDDEIIFKNVLFSTKRKDILEITDSFLQRVKELQAHNERLREALEACKYDCHTGEVILIAEKALSSTPAQSLAEHDNEVVERCAKVCDEQAHEPEYYEGELYCAEEIRALKGEPL